MTIYGLTITETIISEPIQTGAGIEEVTIIGSATGINSDLYNTIIGIKNYNDFITKVPQAHDLVKKAVQSYFNNHPSGVLSYFPAFNDETTSLTDEALLEFHLTYGINAIGERTDLALRIILIPEAEDITDQAKRTNIFAATNTMCSLTNWVYYFNAATASTTKELVIAERNLYASPLGHSSFYYGRYKNAADELCPIAPVAAAILARRSVEEGLFKPNAGAKYPIVGAVSIEPHVDTEAEFNELVKNGINVVQPIPKYGYCLWSSRTLSKDVNTIFNNTRIAISSTEEGIEEILTPFLHDSYDPQGRQGRAIRRSIESFLNRMFLEGAFGGATADTSYVITEEEIPPENAPKIPNLPDGGAPNPLTQPSSIAAANARRYTKLRIYIHFVGSTELIEVGLHHTLQPEIYG